MNDLDLMPSRSTAVATTGVDPFAAYGAQQQNGLFLSFSRVGEFEAGQDKEQVPFGTRLFAFMPGLRRGWRCWVGGTVVTDYTTLLTEMVPLQRRQELGDTDQSLWERDKEGKPRDPWVVTDLLEMSDGTTLYTFSATSKGGRGAVQKLCAEYARERRARPGMLPIITLGRDSYQHSTYGKTYFPVFVIVGWTDEENPSVEGEAEEPLPENQYIDRNGEIATKPGQRAANPTQGASGSVTLNAAAASTSMTTFRSDAGAEYREAAGMKADAKRDLHAAGKRLTRF